jgi:hypothetical protein
MWRREAPPGALRAPILFLVDLTAVGVAVGKTWLWREVGTAPLRSTLRFNGRRDRCSAAKMGDGQPLAVALG